MFFSVLMGSQPLGQTGIYVEAFTQAQAAAATIFAIIDRQPPIDSSSTTGKEPKKEAGNMYFNDVHFNYPSRKDVKV